MEILAIDIGFGFTKASNGSRSLVFKSILGEAKEIQFKGGMLGENTPGENIQIELDGTSYFVGEMAERQSNVRSFTLDQAQFFGSFAKQLALAAAAQMVNSYTPVSLVTGLPIGYYREYKDGLVKLLLGDHKVVLINANGQPEEKVIKISNVRVIPQPFGSLFNLMLNEVGELGNKRYVREKTGVIDIGFKTSDFTVADRMRYSERGSRTTDSGISKAFSIIADKLREKSNVNIELFRLYEAVDQGVIKIRGKEFDLKGITDQVFGQLAKAIASEVDRLWTDDWDIDTIVLTGGGGAVLAKYLQPLISGKVVAVDPATDARLCNVQGYWKFGKHVWSRGVVQPPAQQIPAGSKP
ncbi:MAG: ParM/StbA family protein [Desulfobacteraceae bacterium]|nr:ParM/StbA family protein [Desulfobacteraceae bacterium]